MGVGCEGGCRGWQMPKGDGGLYTYVLRNKDVTIRVIIYDRAAGWNGLEGWWVRRSLKSDRGRAHIHHTRNGMHIHSE